MPYFGLVLFDNGSTDGTAEILRRYAAQDDRIVYMHSPRNLMPADAANRIWPVALAEWGGCAWFLPAGADDVMHEDYLEAVLDAAAAHPEANLIFSPWQWLGHPEKGVKRFPSYDPETVHQIHQLPAWSAFTRELWDALGGHDPKAG